MSSSSISGQGPAALSGLISGFDSSSYISSIMQVAAAPQNLLKTRLASTQSSISALQSLNTQSAALATAAQALSQPAAYSALAASTGDSTVATAVVNGTPTAAASLSFSVTSLAAAHSVIGPAWSSSSSASGAQQYVITHSNGSTVTVNAASSSPSDIAAAINNPTTGDPSLDATVVTSSDGTQKLVVASSQTGSTSQFSIGRVTNASTSPPQTSPYGTVLTQGSNAQLTLADGTNITSSTNTFTGIMTGVDLTVLKTGSTSVSTSTNTAGIVSQVGDLVSKINAIVGLVATNTQSKPGTAGQAGTSGPLAGETSVNSYRMQLLSAVSGTTGGLDPADAGISADENGNLTFDSTKFTAALTKNPAAAQAVVSGLATQINTIAKQASDPVTGTLTQMITGDQANASTLTSSISDWDNRLAIQQQTLQAQFNAMESALSQIQSQGSALSSALASLGSN